MPSKVCIIGLDCAAPELVYRHTADMIGLGADIETREKARRRIGFCRSLTAD